MRQTDNEKPMAGPLLGRPAILLPETGKASVFLFYAVLLLLGGAGSMGCFFTAFGLKVNPVPVGISLTVCTLLCTVRFRLPRRGWCVGAPAALLWAVLVWIHFEDLAEAFKRMVNVISAAYSARLQSPLPIFLNMSFIFPDREEYLFTLFAVLIHFPFCLCLSWILIRHKSSLGAFCLTGLLLLFPLAFSILPASWALGLLGLFWVFLLLSASSLRQRKLLSKEQRCFHLTSAGFVRVSTLALLPAAAVLMLVVSLAFPAEDYKFSETAEELRTTAAQRLRDLPTLFRNGSGGGNVNRVDLAALDAREYTGKTVLRVRHQWEDEWEDAPKKEYLKSFVGSVYTGTSWEKLSRQEALEAEEALGDVKAQTLYSSLCLDVPGDRYIKPENAYQISVRRENREESRMICSPYGLRLGEGESLPQGTDWQDDGCLRASGWFSGPESYDFTAVPLWSTRYLPFRFGNALVDSTQIPEGVVTIEGGVLGGTESLTEEEKNTLLEIQDYVNQLNWESRGDIGWDRTPLPEHLKEFYTGGGLDVLNAAERYTEFVYDHYTQLPEETRDFALEYLSQYGIDSPEGVDRFAIAREIQYMLAVKCEYTLAPPALPQGEDFVEYFLTESRRGYCVHFATAGVVLLRALGIPARFADGYVSPVKNGSWVNVPDRNAHAWVEIFLSGSGWIPVEMTPAGPDAPAAYETAAAPEEQGPTPEPTPSETPRPERRPDDPGLQQPQATPSPTPLPAGPGPGSFHGPGQERELTWLRWLLPPGILLLAVFLLWAVRALRLRLRRRAFAQPDRNKAALALYSHILKLRPIADAQPTGINLPEDSPRLLALQELALKARFGRDMLSEDELGQLSRFAATLQKQLSRTLPLPAKLWYKYIRALF